MIIGLLDCVLLELYWNAYSVEGRDYISLQPLEWSLLSVIYGQLVLRDGWAMIATLSVVQ